MNENLAKQANGFIANDNPIDRPDIRPAYTGEGRPPKIK